VGKPVLTLAEQEKVPPTRGLAISVDYLIESSEIGGEQNEIIRIAWDAVERRRQAAAKQGAQLRLNGTIQDKGYVTYGDYEQYMEERKQREQLRFGWDIAKVMREISDNLLSEGWTVSRKRPETRFYPPRLG